MAKKRKSRTSEPQQPDPSEPVQPEPEPEPEPVQEQVVVEEEVEEEMEEVGEEEEEEEEEEVDYEENKGQDDAVLEAKNNETLENANNNSSNDGVVAEQAKANGGGGEENKEEEDEELEDEPIEKLLEPFTKDQLLILLKEAVSEHPDFVKNVKKLADLDPVHRKIFVHGLGWDTTTETLTDVFGKYGQIEDCKAVTDKATGKSKGYGFILFKHRSGAKRALEEPQKRIGNRMTSCQLAAAGPVLAPPPTTAPPVSEYTQRKIFVSNVGADLDPNKLLDFFSKYGEIEDGPLGLDKQTGKAKGFCLFVYKTVESAKKALEEPHKNFEGHMLNCQKAVDGPKPSKGGSGSGGYYQQQQQQHHGHHQHSQQQHYGHTAKKGRYSGSSGASGAAGTRGHLMAPSAGPAAVGYNPAVAPAALTPALGQALALLATQGAGFGFGNLLGGIGAPANQGVGMAPGGYGGQGGGGYGVQPGLQGGYQNPQMGQGGVRPPQGGGPYMGHGH